MKKIMGKGVPERKKLDGRIKINELFSIKVPDYSPADLKRIRKKIKLSQSQMAALTGYKLRSIQNWEAKGKAREVSDGVKRTYQMIDNPKSIKTMINIFKEETHRGLRVFG